jgi:GDP-mannose 6-dehydrogenase
VSLSISVFGLGYVGSVTAACFASMGHRVTGVDVSAAKVEMMNAGRAPIIEGRMSELVQEGHRAGRLQATTDASLAIRNSEVAFVCVGTPSLRGGKLDLTHIEQVAREIGEALREKRSPVTIVLRSTVLPGTTESAFIPVLESISGRKVGDNYDVCYNPEFLREGTAVSDFLQPPYTVLGSQAAEDLVTLRELYRPTPARIFETNIAVAEMVKYVSNTFHALKVGFANEIGTLCKHLEVDAEMVTRIFTSDTKLNISSAYLSPGFAFGGSCLPKDLRALTSRAKELDLRLPLLQSILESNAEHIDRAVDAVLSSNKRKVGMLGLSFKSGTDDLRESPQVQLVKRLLGEGCQVRIWDEDVSMGRIAGSNRQYIEEVIPHIGSLLSTNLEEVVRTAEVVVVGRRSIDQQRLSSYLTAQQVVIDLVNLESSRRPGGGASCQGVCW